MNKKRILPFLFILAMLFAIIPGTGNVEATKGVVKVKQGKMNKKKSPSPRVSPSSSTTQAKVGKRRESDDY